jgi:hypothetical protein
VRGPFCHSGEFLVFRLGQIDPNFPRISTRESFRNGRNMAYNSKRDSKRSMKIGGMVWIMILSLILLSIPQCSVPLYAAETTSDNSSASSGDSGESAQSAEREAAPSAVLHVLAGASSALLVSAVAYPLVDLNSDRNNALLVAGLGVCGSLAAGAAKELLDIYGWGQPDISDLLLTLGGGLLAASAVYALNTACGSEGEKCGGIPAVYTAFALVLSLPVGENLYRRAIPSSRSRS